jgi:hypothetical protein
MFDIGDGSAQRLELARELIEDGQFVKFGMFQLARIADRLRVNIQTNFYGEPSEQLRRAEAGLDELRERTPSFEPLLALPRRYAIIDDYGTGWVELGHWEDGVYLGGSA